MAGGVFELMEGDFPPLPSSSSCRPVLKSTSDKIIPSIDQLFVGSIQIHDTSKDTPQPIGSDSPKEVAIDLDPQPFPGSHKQTASSKSPSKLSQAYLRELVLQPIHKISGVPCVSFKVQDKSYLLSKIRFMVVAKFSHGRPKLFDFNSFLASLRFEGSYKMIDFDSKHIFLDFEYFEDFAKIWMLRSRLIKGFRVRFFRWSEEFNPATESAVTPVWVHLPCLPFFLFNEDSILSIASLFGDLLYIDPRNLEKRNVGYLSFCVALDVKLKRLEGFWIEFVGEGIIVDRFWQAVKYDSLPSFCSHCSHLGHRVELCKVARKIKDISLEIGSGISGDDGQRKDVHHIITDGVPVTTVFNRLFSGLRSDGEVNTLIANSGLEKDVSDPQDNLKFMETSATPAAQNGCPVSARADDTHPLGTFGSGEKATAVSDIDRNEVLLEDTGCEVDGSSDGDPTPVELGTGERCYQLDAAKNIQTVLDKSELEETHICYEIDTQNDFAALNESYGDIEQEMAEPAVNDSAPAKDTQADKLQISQANQQSSLKDQNMEQPLSFNATNKQVLYKVGDHFTANEVAIQFIQKVQEDKAAMLERAITNLREGLPLHDLGHLATVESKQPIEENYSPAASQSGSCNNEGKVISPMTNPNGLDEGSPSGTLFSENKGIKQSKPNNKSKQGNKKTKSKVKKKYKKQDPSEDEEDRTSPEYWQKLQDYRDANPFTEEQNQEAARMVNSCQGGFYADDFTDDENEVNSFYPRHRKFNASSSPSLAYLNLEDGISALLYQDYPP